jgi:oligopeptide/dipeptide ABC transporter ATP-binding protein
MPVPLLEVRSLTTRFATPRGALHAVDGVSFSLDARNAVGVVGESGSGKSVTALSILRLFGALDRVAVSGEVLFDGVDLLRLPEKELRRMRGAEIGMVFQDPLTSLNPAMPVGEQIAETLRYHRGMAPPAARRRSEELMERVGIGEPRRRYEDLPDRFSGGMRQRIMIAVAIACEPKLLIADEPTTALDVTVQAQVLNLINELREQLGMALMMISHDFGVVAASCDWAQVMYGGRLVERGSVQDILEHPRHPYTAALLQLVPGLELAAGQRLKPIPGQPAPVFGSIPGCRFAGRCEFADQRCRGEDPPVTLAGAEHWSACWLEDPGLSRQETRGMRR